MANSNSFNEKTIKNIVIGVSSAVILPYVLWFITHPISRHPEDWGNFGDYIGGILNPLLTIINIYLLIQLSVKVESREDQKVIKDIKLKIYSELVSTLFEYDIKRVKFNKSEMDHAQKLYTYLILLC